MKINSIGPDASLMNAPNQERRGWTLVEMLLIIAVIVFFAAIVSSLVAMQRRNSTKINSVNDIRQVEFPFKTWSADSNKLSSMKLVVCSTDKAKTMAESFSAGKFDGRVSYFVGVDASNSYPQIIEVGGRNLASNGVERCLSESLRSPSP